MKFLYIHIIGFLTLSLSLSVFEQHIPWKEINHSNYVFSYAGDWKLKFRDNSDEGFSIQMSSKKYSPEIRMSVLHFPERIDLKKIPINYGDIESIPGYNGSPSEIDTSNSETTYISMEEVNYWKRIEIDTILRNGHYYIEAIHELTNDEGTYRRIWRTFDQESTNSRYGLVFSCKQEEWKIYEADVKKMFDSFRPK